MSVWIRRGKLSVRRDALDSDDPDHPYNYIQRTYGVNPEDYGIERPQRHAINDAGQDPFQ